MIENGEYYLVTTDGWFMAPDGNEYRAAYGKAKVLTTKETLGFNPVRSTNWFIKIGEGNKSIIIAGCQIHYAIRSDQSPVIKTGTFVNGDGKECQCNWIYIAY